MTDEQYIPDLISRCEEFGINKPACQNCHHVRHETDGDFGEIDCGWLCFKTEDVTETEPDALCDQWVPDFWQTPFPDEISAGTIDDVTEALDVAQKKFMAVIKGQHSIGG